MVGWILCCNFLIALCHSADLGCELPLGEVLNACAANYRLLCMVGPFELPKSITKVVFLL